MGFRRSIKELKRERFRLCFTYQGTGLGRKPEYALSLSPKDREEWLEILDEADREIECINNSKSNQPGAIHFLMMTINL